MARNAWQCGSAGFARDRVSALGLGLLLTACASPPVAGGEELVNGAVSADASVLAVIHTRPDGTRQLCTGTLVAPTAVITAKHCVYEDIGGSAWTAIPVTELSVSLGDSVAGATGSIDVIQVTTSAGPYHSGDGAVGGDLAVLTLASPASGLTPHEIGAGVPSTGEGVRIVGFGYTGAGSTGTLGTRHEGSASITSVSAGTFTTEGASWTCTGDSGGPAFRESDGALIGVTSIGPRGCPASASIATRIDQNLDVLAMAGIQLPDADAGPSPSDAAATDAGSASDGGAAPPRTTGGCGCRVEHAASPVGAILVVALSLLVLRVRKRR